MPMTSEKMVRFLKKNGFKEIPGGKVCHRKFRNPVTGRVVQVPYHSKDLGKGLEQTILKQAGLKK